jgi:hypothetical protein
MVGLHECRGRDARHERQSRHGGPESLAAGALDCCYLRQICGTAPLPAVLRAQQLPTPGGPPVNGLIYLIGLIVVILFILSFLGLR